MIDWMIAKIASSGMRGTRLRLRQATTRPSSSAWRRPPVEAGASRSGERSCAPPGRPAAGTGPASSASARAASAAWPVRARKTSSSVGRRRPMSSIAMPASSRSRTTWTRRWAPPLAGTVSRRVCSSTRAVALAVAGEQLGRAGDVGPRVDDDLDPLAADLRLQLVGGAAGDDPAGSTTAILSASSPSSTRVRSARRTSSTPARPRTSSSSRPRST